MRILARAATSSLVMLGAALALMVAAVAAIGILLSCPVCAPVHGTSCCVPLTVGGEESTVLLHGTSITQAIEIAEPVRMAAAEISLPGSDVSVTASVGVAVFPDHTSTPDRLERLADAALYLAKRQGRNRVELAD